MQRCMGLVALLGLVCAGCGVELLTTTAIQGELQAEQAKALKRQVGNASRSMGRVNIQRAIDTYTAEKGYYPASLDELVPGYLASLPAQSDGTPYGYDPATGKLLEGAAASQPPTPPGQITPGDVRKMTDIRQSMDRYGRTTGYYPPSLQALVPTYLTALPKTDSGQDFVYYPQTGALLHPSEVAGQGAAPPAPQHQGRQAGRAQGGGGAGVGPMGEVMTGMAVQKELNSMSNAGSSAVGGYGRRKLRDATQGRNAQQEKVMDDLGL